MKTIINSPKAPAPYRPHTVRRCYPMACSTYLVVRSPIDQATGQLVSTSVEDETRQVMKNLSYILEAAGASFANVLKCSIFIKDMGRVCADPMRCMASTPPKPACQRNSGGSAACQGCQRGDQLHRSALMSPWPFLRQTLSIEPLLKTR